MGKNDQNGQDKTQETEGVILGIERHRESDAGSPRG